SGTCAPANRERASRRREQDRYRAGMPRGRAAHRLPRIVLPRSRAEPTCRGLVIPSTPKRRTPMPTRNAEATWKGTLQGGNGSYSGESGTLTGTYSFGTRFGDQRGSNPEELLAAAHAACFSMALSLQ